MRWPSISLIISEVFLAYIAYAIYVLSQLFVAPTCEEGKFCLTSYLSTKPRLQLHMFSSINRNPMEREVTIVNTISSFDYNEIQDIPVKLNIPRKTQQNGTMFLHMLLVPESKRRGRSFNDLKRDSYMAYTVTKMTQYAIPEAETFNLLGKKDAAKDGTRKSKELSMHPVTHLKSRVTFTVMTDDIKLPIDNIPMELINNIRVVQSSVFLPIVNFDFLQTRQRDLVRVTPQNNTMNVTVSYTPITLGKLRLMLHIEATMHSLENLGFSNKNTDELKAIFADTNIYLLAATFIIAALHLLFDFLTFKNDVSFWRRKDNLIGLSKWTVIWRAFSQTVIFFYLLDENSSLLVLLPTGIGTLIEFWKIKKVMRAEFVRGPGILPRIRFNTSKTSAAELKTREFDAESMRYLSYLLYPLVIGGAIYSLLYQPYKSWYSWIINSLVKGVYAFGFLFMLPQLFVNYKLKSVAHLPWRAFMYKAFNTLIDDVFAFIITMPTAHRIACFRDDVVFLIYLYQRSLYPVDKTRIDADAITEEAVNLSASDKKSN